MQQDKCAIIAFARAPVLGKVKTRLAAGIGDEAALSVYKACAANVLSEMSKVDAELFCCHPDANERPLMQSWLASLSLHGVQIRTQVTNLDLGERMLAALQHVRSSGFERMLVVGTDVPDITAATLTAALQLLDSHDVVFGPARDGGFYLVAMRQPHKEVFTGVLWSTDQTLRQSVSRAREAGLSVAPHASLPCLRDIDTRSDLEVWLQGATATSNAEHRLLAAAQRALQGDVDSSKQVAG